MAENCQASPCLREHFQAATARVVSLHNAGHAVHEPGLLVHVLCLFMFFVRNRRCPLKICRLAGCGALSFFSCPLCWKLCEGCFVALLKEDLYRQFVHKLGPASAAKKDGRLAPCLSIQLQDVPRCRLLCHPGAVGLARDFPQQLLGGHASLQRRRLPRQLGEPRPPTLAAAWSTSARGAWPASPRRPPGSATAPPCAIERWPSALGKRRCPGPRRACCATGARPPQSSRP